MWNFRVFPSDDIDSEEEIFAEIQIHAIVEHRNSLMILTRRFYLFRFHFYRLRS